MNLVLDTNVLAVANESHDGVSPDCIIACVERLQHAMKNRIVVDDMWLILSEYKRQMSLTPAKGPGDIFLKWILQNTGNDDRVRTVEVTQPSPDRFEQFPNDELQDAFDPPDRKFVAVAYAHHEPTTVLQAADCKWLKWHIELREHGVNVEFVCPDDICRFFRGKFPNEPVPNLV